MAFQVSPGVLVQERDLTRIIPAVSTSIGAIAGEFRQAPLDEIVSISSENDLVETFGKPDSSNFEDFFSGLQHCSRNGYSRGRLPCQHRCYRDFVKPHAYIFLTAPWLRHFQDPSQYLWQAGHRPGR